MDRLIVRYLLVEHLAIVVVAMDLKIDTPDDLPLTEEKITVEVDKLMYYQKPALGGQGHPAVPASLAGQDSSFPIQIIFPSGNFGLG